MKPSIFLLFTLFPTLVWAETFDKPIHERTTIDAPLKVAQPVAPVQPVVVVRNNANQPVELSEAELKANPTLTQQLLSEAIYARNPEVIGKLLAVYRTFPHADPILIQFAQAKIFALTNEHGKAVEQYRNILAQNPALNPVRFELATSLFYDKQLSAAEDQFNKVKTDPNMPAEVQQMANAYLDAIQKNSEWYFSATAYYVRESNVNNVANAREIENTGYIKNDNMMPEKAQGLAYSINFGKDFNLVGRHYLALDNDFYGKSYWDNHDYDDISNRTYLGYRYKTPSSTFSLLPFYEKRWYGNESYQWANGVRAEFSHWLNPNWQVVTALEHSKQRYFDSTAQNGNSKLVSGTLIWLRNPKQFFTFGADFNRESTWVKQYSTDTKGIRLSWGQEWELGGFSSRLSVGISQRQYKDQAKLGGFLALGKVRQDKIYSANLTLWKRDWHLWGITPKLQFSWRKNDSNLPTMYSYTRKNVNLIFEKTF
ncbi:surface lipoprotein assembly modifier [Mannheimia indoligenes]|uniref:surface lipoprotein assembly modifier n=1 Tax=Mannheimia indoligenes TaxID=3103145 RepID=UPI002FE6B26B